jgi:hypothetical protein
MVRRVVADGVAAGTFALERRKRINEHLYELSSHMQEVRSGGPATGSAVTTSRRHFCG